MIRRRATVMVLRIFAAIVMLQLIVVSASAGPAEDAALREAAMNLDIFAAKDALAKGANPNATSSGPRPLTPLQAVTFGMLGHRVRDANSKALEIAKVLFSNGAKIGVSDRNI